MDIDLSICCCRYDCWIILIKIWPIKIWDWPATPRTISRAGTPEVKSSPRIPLEVYPLEAEAKKSNPNRIESPQWEIPLGTHVSDPSRLKQRGLALEGLGLGAYLCGISPQTLAHLGRCKAVILLCITPLTMLCQSLSTVPQKYYRQNRNIKKRTNQYL